MEQKQSAQQNEGYNIQSNAENNHNKDYLVEIFPIDDTPFILVKQTDQWFISLGHTRITNTRPTKEEALQLLETEKWNAILAMIVDVVEKRQEILKNYTQLVENEKGSL